jgi:hypothetical protein
LVTVLNGINGLARTSFKRAHRFVRQGRAIQVSESVIRMVTTDHRHKSAISADERQRRIDYDITVNSGGLTQRQAKGIPFAGSVARLGLPA